MITVDELHRALGDFWYRQFPQQEELQALLLSVLEVQKQVQQDVDELLQSMSRKTVPEYHTVRWYPLTVTPEQYAEYAKEYAKYDGSYTYESILQFDVEQGLRPKVKLPDEIHSVRRVTNRILNPEVAWDVTLDGHWLFLPENPFQAAFRQDDGSALLWLENVEVDTDNLYTQFGYLFGLRHGGREMLNLLFDTLLHGPSHACVMGFLSLVTGIPVCRTDGERVVEITRNRVTTDHNQYTFSENDTLTVHVGDVLRLGDTMSEGLQLTNDVPALKLGKGFVPLCLDEDLLVVNRETPVAVTYPDGVARLDFPLSGAAKDVQRFNDLLHQNGLAACQKITSPCELNEIYAKYPGLRPADEPQVEPEAEDMNTGLLSFLRFHRFR